MATRISTRPRRSSARRPQAKFPFFIYEAPNVFYIALPDIATGACPSGTIPVYRVWDNRADTNHRYMTSLPFALRWSPRAGSPKAMGPTR